LAGVLAALAGDFGVSEKFIAVRLSRYGLVEGGM
jgi:Zn-dependent peptidase ImmA (M78 family)